MNMTSYYSIHGLVTVKTNVHLNIPDHFLTDTVTDPDITVTIGPLDIDVDRSEKKKRAGYSVWKHNDSLVIDYEVVDLKLLVGGLHEGGVRVSCTEQFAKRRMSHINSLVKLIIQLKLIEKNHCFVHAGCIARDDTAIVIPALGSTGKTYTTLSLVDGNNTYYLSDDLAIIGEDGRVYSYPTSANTGPYVLKNESVPEFNADQRFMSKLTDIPLVSLLIELFPWLHSSKTIHPPESVIRDMATLGDVFLITHGNADSVTPISTSTAVNETLVQHFDTHGLFQNYILNYYSYLFDYDLTRKIDEMRAILSNAFTTGNCYELRSNTLQRYPQLIREEFQVSQ